tara:strand:- start:54 stop:2114 length:2061 start_codon:yes stop_codon:yes gene_type:complete
MKYKIRSGTSKKIVLVIVDKPAKSYGANPHKTKIGDDLLSICNVYLPKLEVHCLSAVPAWVEKIGIKQIREHTASFWKELDKIKPTVIVSMGKDSHRALAEISVDVPVFECGSIHDYSEKKISFTNVHQTFTRAYHTLKGTLYPIPITSNLSRIVMQSARYNELAVDFEWNPETGVPHSVGLAAGQVAGGFLLNDRVREVIKNAFQNKNMVLVGHNIVADCRKLFRYIGNGIQCKFIDTLLLKRQLDFSNKQLGLKHLADRYLLLEDYWTGIEYKDFFAPSPKLLKYTAGDAWATLLLWSRLYEDHQDKWEHMAVARELDMHMVLPVSYMVEGGIKIDTKILNKQRKALRKQEVEVLDYFTKNYDINPASPLQVLEVLQKKHKVKSSGVEVLTKLNTTFANKVLEYRKVNKLLTTYIDKIPEMADEHGLIHCNLSLAGTVTGRMSSSKPNMQNIPPSVRGIFKSVFDEEGVLITVDASQSELRCLAYLSGSKYLIDAYAKGTDMHTLVSDLAGIKRKNAKVLNFAYVYGSSKMGLINQLIMSGLNKSEANKIVIKFLETMKEIGIDSYQRSLIDKAKQNGYIYSPYGRVGTRLNTTQVVNFPIQSFSADLNKERIIYMFNKLKEKKLVSRIWMEFHDAMELDVYKPELDTVRELLDTIDTRIPDVLGKGINIQLPLDVKEHGVNWE